MTERLGIEIDYCPQCRGVWLDRGELDKVIERSTREAAQAAPAPTAQPIQQPHDTRYDQRQGQYEKRYEQNSGYRQKKSIWHELFD
jgi:hypothetical protein